MKTWAKVVVAVMVLLLTLLACPMLVVRFADAGLGMSLVLLQFFAVNPLVAILLGILAGTEIKRLWWIPLADALTFPLFFGLAVSDPYVFELYIYSVIYLVLGALAMLVSALVCRWIFKRS